MVVAGIGRQVLISPLMEDMFMELCLTKRIVSKIFITLENLIYFYVFGSSMEGQQKSYVSMGTFFLVKFNFPKKCCIGCPYL